MIIASLQFSKSFLESFYWGKGCWAKLGLSGECTEQWRAMKEKAWKSLCLELGSVGTGSIQHADMPECKVLEISWCLWISSYLHNMEQRTFSLRHSRSRLWQQVGLVNPRQMWLSWHMARKELCNWCCKFVFLAQIQGLNQIWQQRVFQPWCLLVASVVLLD